MRVEVTQEDIGKGVARAPNNCPIALALKRAGWARASVSASAIGFKARGAEKFYWTYAVPENAKSFLFDFDAGRPVSPFSFDLPDVTEVKDAR